VTTAGRDGAGAAGEPTEISPRASSGSESEWSEQEAGSQAAAKKMERKSEVDVPRARPGEVRIFGGSRGGGWRKTRVHTPR
jgi:hypothetical protein